MNLKSKSAVVRTPPVLRWFKTRMVPSALLIFAISSVCNAAPRLQLSSVAVGPIFVAAGGTSTQSVEAANPGDGALSLSVQTSAPWLTATVGGSRACTTTTGNCFPINISLSPGALPAGTYTEYVKVSDPNAVDAPQQVSVTMTVGGVPSSLTLYGAPGANGTNGAPAYSLLYPTSAVNGTVATQSGGSWLQFTLGGGGSFSFGTPYSVQATPLGTMAPGSYSGSVALSGSGNAADNKTIGVTFNVTTAPIIQLPAPSIRISSFPGATATSAVSFTNLGQGTLNITNATVTAAGAAPASTFSATASGGTVTITADPGSLAAGIYTGNLTISSNAANNDQVTVPVSFEVQSSAPLISQGGIINIATYQLESLAQGGIAAVYGNQLAAAGTSLSSPSVPLVKTLASVQVLVNGTPAPLYYVSPGQVNFQIPYETPAGSLATIQVVNGGQSSNMRAVQVNAAVPRIMPWPAYLVPGNNGIVVNYGDGSLVLPKAYQLPGYSSHPAKPGDLLIIYCLGFGQTSPAAITGAAGAAQPASTNVTVTFAGGFSGLPVQATPLFAGLSGGVGLYQVNVYVPNEITYGPAVSLTLNQGGVISNFVTIPISADGN